MTDGSSEGAGVTGTRSSDWWAHVALGTAGIVALGWFVVPVVLEGSPSGSTAVASPAPFAAAVGMLLASTSVPDSIRDRSAAIGALVALLLGAAAIVSILLQLTSG